jgi:hypothetical protein
MVYRQEIHPQRRAFDQADGGAPELLEIHRNIIRSTYTLGEGTLTFVSARLIISITPVADAFASFA